MAEVPDGFELVKDGTVRLHLDGERWKLRRPKIGEFRKLRELLYETQEEARRITNIAVDAEQAKNDKPEDPELVEAAKRASNGLSSAVEDMYGEWMREAFDALADKPLPEAQDDWPVWLATAQPISELLEHWRTAPLARSVG